MEIPNFTQKTAKPTSPQKNNSPSLKIVFLMLFIASVLGFIASRVFPTTGKSSTPVALLSSGETALSTEDIKDQSELEVGKLYGNTSANFKDSATGTIEKGAVNGVGTHILVRPGGDSQRVSLTSSAVDLDLFVNRQVEVKGETNTSSKTGWLMDVGSIKIVE
jgi:hypothetical protein